MRYSPARCSGALISGALLRCPNIATSILWCKRSAVSSSLLCTHHTTSAYSGVTFLFKSTLLTSPASKRFFLLSFRGSGTAAMASSSQLSELPCSPPRRPFREPRSLKRRPFKDPEATPRAVRRPRSVSNSPATRCSDVERRPMLPESPFGPLVGYCQGFFRGEKRDEGEGL